MPSDKAHAVEARLNDLIGRAGPADANTGYPDITGTALNQRGSLTVPAGTVTGDRERYQGNLAGAFTCGGTPPASLTISVMWGGTGGAALAAVSVPGAGLYGSASFFFSADFDAYWKSATRAAARLVLWWHTANGLGGTMPYHAGGDTTGLDTSADANLVWAIQQTGANPGTITVHGSHISRTA